MDNVYMLAMVGMELQFVKSIDFIGKTILTSSLEDRNACNTLEFKDVEFITIENQKEAKCNQQ